MKPLRSGTQDSDMLQNLGRASIQIVHDLKNQLNGLKLYATFLRKRLEKSDRPVDEQETLTKLIRGLDKAASDLSTIVQYGRPIDPKLQPQVDLQRILRNVCSTLGETTGTPGRPDCSISVESEPQALYGKFDPTLLAEALRSISIGALTISQQKTGTQRVVVHVRRDRTDDGSNAIIEWRGVNCTDHDPFKSFAGSTEIRMSLAAKTVEAHGGSVSCEEDSLSVSLPLTG